MSATGHNMKRVGCMGMRCGGYRLGLFGAAMMLHLVSASALAQRPAGPPSDGGGLFTWVVLLAVGILTVGIAFLNPKRSHQA